MTHDEGDGFEQAKRIIGAAIGDCLTEQIDPALVAAVLIGAGVNWVSRYQGEQAVVAMLHETIRDIRAGTHAACAAQPGGRLHH